MFGRDFNSSKLLNLTTSPNNPAFKPQPTIETETELSHPNLTQMDIDEITDPYEPQNKDNEWVETIAATRKTDKKNAKQNIKKEQKVQIQSNLQHPDLQVPDTSINRATFLYKFKIKSPFLW